VWRTTTQAEIGGAPESKASIAQWNAFKCSLRSIGISPNGLRPTGYNFWLVRGVPEHVVKKMGAWAAKSTIPSRHYLRVHLIDQVFKAAAMPIEELE
jgi:intergrase/recombinase